MHANKQLVNSGNWSLLYRVTKYTLIVMQHIINNLIWEEINLTYLVFWYVLIIYLFIYSTFVDYRSKYLFYVFERSV